MPCCARGVDEDPGARIDMCKALRLRGRYDMDDERIDEATRQAIRNDMAVGAWHFRARY